MDAGEILDLIKNGEDSKTEFKESFHSVQEISKILCSFANTCGGILFIGVKNNSEIAGIKEDEDRLQQKIANSAQSISPAPLISIESHKISGKKIFCVSIQRSPDGFYYTYQGAIYVRAGSVTKRLEGQTHLNFLRNRQILSFDDSYDTAVQIEDLDESKIKSYLKERKHEKYLEEKSVKDFLISNRLAILNESLKIKNSAVLLFGKEPSRFHPQSEVKLVKFSGTESVDIISYKLLQNDIVSLIEESISFIKENTNKALDITGTKRKDIYEYPENVIRESIVNAIAHRDYFSKDATQISIFRDRLEITNPGSLPAGLTKEFFGSISVQRNPTIYRILRDMGYIEGLGTGIPRMKNEMRNRRLPDPEFKIMDSFFRLILHNRGGSRKAIESPEDLNERQKKALEYLKKHATLKSHIYAEMNEVSCSTAVKEISELLQYGYLKKIGTFRGAYYILKGDSA